MTESDMLDHEPTAASRRKKQLAGAVGPLLVGEIAGGALAATSSASAAGNATSFAAASSAAAVGPKVRADAATPVCAGERVETGTDLATLKAAALKAVPGGTVYRIETDADGATYEAHMTKADGAHVTVKFDKDLKVTAVQDGMGAGGPGGPAGGTAPTSSGAGA